MRRILLLTLIVTSLSALARTEVNPIIKDQSFIYFMGQQPDENTNNELRVICHLLYAEHILRKKDVSHLSPEKQTKRVLVLDHLKEYALAGRYPQNYDYEGERKPCFIDKDGAICAVGYLVEQTAGIDAAISINSEYQYAEIYEMDLEVIKAWAEENGLTLEECAIIQPTYGWHDTKRSAIEINPLANYRGLAQFAFGIQLMYVVHGQGWQSKIKGIGVEMQRLAPDAYSAGLRLQYGNYRLFKIITPYLALNSEFFWSGNRSGFNLKPEFGFHYKRFFNRFYAHANLNYGYHIGLNNQEFYPVGRNNLGLTLGLGINL